MRAGIWLGAVGLSCCLAGLPVAGWGASPEGVTVTGGAAKQVVLTAAELAALPSVTLSVSFKTDRGTMQARFTGPLLWTILANAHAVDPQKPRGQVRQVVTVTGADGYAAAFAAGEISPAFEGKTVILAEQMNGKTLSPAHLRLVVPGDKYGGRSVRDVVGITVTPSS